MANVEILEVEQAVLNRNLLWDARLDLPVAGERRNHYTLVVAGWVLHRDRDDLVVEAVTEGRTVGRGQCNLLRPDVASQYAELPISPACGFMGVVRTLDLPPSFELHVEIVGRVERMPLGVIRGRRSSIGSPEGIRPVLVTTLGRTGSTLLMLLLGCHPQIVVHPPFPFETRVASYWTSIFNELASPSSYLQALAAGDARRYWWIGYSVFPVETYVDQDAAAQWLGGHGVEALAAFAQRQVRQFYEASWALRANDRGTAAWFAEKQLPDAGLQQIQTELFPDGRAIFLVRDFRDMMASITAFNRKRRFAGFGSGVHDEEGYILEQGRAVDKLLDTWRRAGNRGLLVRYEDLVQQPQATLERILGFLGLEESGAVVETIMSSAYKVNPGAQLAHLTSADALASIGRWRQDLPPSLADRYGVLFAEALREWGYEP